MEDKTNQRLPLADYPAFIKKADFGKAFIKFYDSTKSSTVSQKLKKFKNWRLKCIVNKQKPQVTQMYSYNSSQVVMGISVQTLFGPKYIALYHGSGHGAVIPSDMFPSNQIQQAIKERSEMAKASESISVTNIGTSFYIKNRQPRIALVHGATALVL